MHQAAHMVSMIPNVELPPDNLSHSLCSPVWRIESIKVGTGPQYVGEPRELVCV
jgi:hypothetical protein